jgi:hypothetical protein
MKRPVIPIHAVGADAGDDTRFVSMYQKRWTSIRAR